MHFLEDYRFHVDNNFYIYPIVTNLARLMLKINKEISKKKIYFQHTPFQKIPLFSRKCPRRRLSELLARNKHTFPVSRPRPRAEQLYTGKIARIPVHIFRRIFNISLIHSYRTIYIVAS